jgi:hypothetical protein
MFSSIFYKRTFSNDEKMRKIMKDSMGKYIRSLDEKCKNPIKINLNEENNSNVLSLTSFTPFIIFGIGVGFYQLYKGFFIKQ